MGNRKWTKPDTLTTSSTRHKPKTNKSKSTTQKDKKMSNADPTNNRRWATRTPPI